jgi:hypothetical protein
MPIFRSQYSVDSPVATNRALPAVDRAATHLDRAAKREYHAAQGHRRAAGFLML